MTTSSFEVPGPSTASLPIVPAGAGNTGIVGANGAVGAVGAPTTAVGPGALGPRHRPVQGALFVLGSCLSLQFGAAFAVQLFPVLGSWGTTGLRLGLAGLILLLVFRPKFWRFTGQQWRAVVLYGLVLAGMNGFFYAALARLDLGVAVAIEFLGPLVLAACLSRRAADFAWTGLALAGIALFFVRDLLAVSGVHAGAGKALDPIGVVLVLVAGGFWAMYVLVGEKASRVVPGKAGLAVGVSIGGALSLPFVPATVPHLSADPKLLLMALAVAVMSSVLPYSLEFSAMRRLPKAAFGVLLSVEPAIAALAGWLLLGQSIGVLGLAAIALVVGASVGSTATARKPEL